MPGFWEENKNKKDYDDNSTLIRVMHYLMPAARTIPAAIAQKRKAIYDGSLIAVLKRTMDNAPTIPRERITFEVTAGITIEVIIVSAISVTPKDYGGFAGLKSYCFRIKEMIASLIATIKKWLYQVVFWRNIISALQQVTALLVNAMYLWI